jgi:hypothetical protein
MCYGYHHQLSLLFEASEGKFKYNQEENFLECTTSSRMSLRSVKYPYAAGANGVFDTKKLVFMKNPSNGSKFPSSR